MGTSFNFYRATGNFLNAFRKRHEVEYFVLYTLHNLGELLCNKLVYILF